MNQQQALLRVCASCEWVFRKTEDTELNGCPKCGFAHYGAHFVYGDAAYRYVDTQKPWLDRKITEYTLKLYKEIDESSIHISKGII
jgi:predicted  nucleic acid-binding Zn-ribbon protein